VFTGAVPATTEVAAENVSFEAAVRAAEACADTCEALRTTG
jgi:hypothetical protein